MGDRGSVYFEQTGVRLYTHSGGHRLFRDVANALKRGKSRWNDPEYLARIIFDEMVGADSGQTTIGYGIDTTDARENTHVVLNTDNKRVTDCSSGGWPSTFDGFIDRHASDNDNPEDRR